MEVDIDVPVRAMEQIDRIMHETGRSMKDVIESLLLEGLTLHMVAEGRTIRA